jgi:membrane-associated phospholipid phosphatase
MKYILRSRLKSSILLLLFIFTTYFFTQLISHANDTIFLLYIDDKIPLVTEFVWIYHTLIPVMAFVLIRCVQSKRLFLTSYLSTVLVVGVLAALYILVPASYPRPDITSTDISSMILKMTYECDGSNNTFPSAHVALALICVLTFINCKLCKNNMCKTLAWIWFFCICASTLLLKQHHIVDVFAGAFVSLGVFKIINGSEYFNEINMLNY